mmetsp:Transcript_93499/g.242016  ORF Transcript_93499/g.242016 Transcript_93499/m.242016 type:complete len:201 (+) Transcript_93499:375-977(+)
MQQIHHGPERPRLRNKLDRRTIRVGVIQDEEPVVVRARGPRDKRHCCVGDPADDDVLPHPKLRGAHGPTATLLAEEAAGERAIACTALAEAQQHQTEETQQNVGLIGLPQQLAWHLVLPALQAQRRIDRVNWHQQQDADNASLGLRARIPPHVAVDAVRGDGACQKGKPAANHLRLIVDHTKRSCLPKQLDKDVVRILRQ